MSNLTFEKWVQLGAIFPGHSAFKGPVDIESLLIETLSVGRTKAVLFDIMLGWLTVYGDLVNIHRLKRMIPEELSAVAGAVFEYFVQKGGHRKFLQVAGACTPFAKGQFLFLATKDSPVSAMETMEHSTQLNTKWNVYFKDIELKTDAIRTQRYVLAKNVFMSARAVFGTSMRADVVGYLVEHGKATINQLTQFLHLDFASVSRELNRMESSMLVKKERSGRNVFISPSKIALSIASAYARG